MFTLIMITVAAWATDRRAPAGSGEPAAADKQLASYNAYLASLNHAEADRQHEAR
jgi:hypothetical protein